MKKNLNLFWLECIFDDDSVKSFKSISPAANFWNEGFIRAIMRQGHNVEVFGYSPERVWPFGKMIISSNATSLKQGIVGKIAGYLNLPFIRFLSQIINLLRLAISRQKDFRPEYFVVFSCLEKKWVGTPAIWVAKYMKAFYNIPWICIVGDGVAPDGADKYVYQNWKYFCESSKSLSCLHLDGGIADLPSNQNRYLEESQKKIFIYMGALTEHGGSLELAKAFIDLREKDIELWFFGRGENIELVTLSNLDRRIKLKGFVSNEDLNKAAAKALAFVDPRPLSFAPNKLNFPSKLLHYLAYGKPVISTFSEGVSPDYDKILEIVKDDTQDSLTIAMQNIIDLPPESYKEICIKVDQFNATHTWDHQVSRFLNWIT